MIEKNLSQTETNKKVSRWIQCFSLVSFDVDEGQKMELIVPDIQFSHETQKQIAMLAFPDSNSFSDNQNTFKYTFKVNNGLYGYTCFKQKKDPSNPRGFSQRSFVILSELPFVYFFQKMAQFIVFKTFNTQNAQDLKPILLGVFEQVAQWPHPSPKCSLVLPIMQYQLTIQIPNYLPQRQKTHSIYNTKSQEHQVERQLQQSNKEFNLKNILTQQKLLKNGPFQEIELCDIFQHCKDGLWSLWQHIMLNKSVLLLGDNPQQVSHGVLGGISLIYPFEYSANFNPYITVYDPNLDKLAKEKNNWVLGGTNPVFQKFFNPQIVHTIPLGSVNGAKFKAFKDLKPLKELIRKSTSEQQRVINEAAVRKHFGQLNKGLMTLLDSYLNQQSNNLKFFNEIQFMKKVKEKKEFLGLQNIFSSKKYVISFIEAFIQTPNFDRYLLSKNTIRTKK